MLVAFIYIHKAEHFKLKSPRGLWRNTRRKNESLTREMQLHLMNSERVFIYLFI